MPSRRNPQYAWQDGAACQDRPPQFADADFYADNRRAPATKLAKQLCGVCPIRLKCLDWALTHDERFGVWGGTDAKERAWLKNPSMKDDHAQA